MDCRGNVKINRNVNVSTVISLCSAAQYRLQQSSIETLQHYYKKLVSLASTET